MVVVSTNALAGTQSWVTELVPYAQVFGPVLTIASVLVAVIAVGQGRRTAIMSMHASVLRDFQKAFADLAGDRFAVSSFAMKRISTSYDHDSPESIPPGLGPIMDFFDQVSMYLKKGYLDEEMAFISFYYWMLPYYTYFSKDIAALKREKPLLMWDEIPKQLSRLRDVGRAMGVVEDEFRKAEKEPRLCFETEIHECCPNRFDNEGS